MAAFDKRKLMREIERERKAAVAKRLAELRVLIKAARVARHAAINEVRLDCREKRQALKASCDARRLEASELGLRGIERQKHVFAHEQAAAKEEAKLGRGPRKARTTKTEREAESDCAVRANLPPELVTVFNKVKRHIKGTPRKSRTEAFLEWAEENPGEVYAAQQREADRELAKLIAEEAHHYRNRNREAVPF
jgi:hypothetical protein